MRGIHRWDDGRLAWGATLRYFLALAYPMWDGAAGRAFTLDEMKMHR